MNILTVNLVFSTLVFFIAAKIYLLPRLGELKPETVLIPILLLHMMRHLGLMFLCARRDLCRDRDAIHLSGRVRRFPGRDPRRHRAGGES